MYVSGDSTVPTILQINVSTLAVVSSKTHTSGQIVSLYSYGSQMLFVNSINSGGAKYQNTLLDMSLSIGSKQWGVRIDCVLFCSGIQSPMISLIWTPTNRAFQLAVEGGYPLFYVLNLSNGSVVGTLFRSVFTSSNLYAADLAYTEYTNTVYILVRHSSGFHIFEYYTNTNSFNNARRSTTYTSYFVAMMNGYTYFGGKINANSAAHVGKVLGRGTLNQDQVFTLTSTSITFTSDGILGYGVYSDSSIAVAAISNPSTSTGTISFVSPGSYTQSGTGSYRSDIVYLNGFSETLYVQSEYVGTIAFGYP